jgi:hypothetical protein
MGDYLKRVVVGIGAFGALALWEGLRGRRSVEKFAEEQANPNSGVASWGDVRTFRGRLSDTVFLSCLVDEAPAGLPEPTRARTLPSPALDPRLSCRADARLQTPL